MFLFSFFSSAPDFKPGTYPACGAAPLQGRRTQRTRWGQCSSLPSISFSYLPLSLVGVVIKSSWEVWGALIAMQRHFQNTLIEPRKYVWWKLFKLPHKEPKYRVLVLFATTKMFIWTKMGFNSDYKNNLWHSGTERQSAGMSETKM